MSGDGVQELSTLNLTYTIDRQVVSQPKPDGGDPTSWPPTQRGLLNRQDMLCMPLKRAQRLKTDSAGCSTHPPTPLNPFVLTSPLSRPH